MAVRVQLFASLGVGVSFTAGGSGPLPPAKGAWTDPQNISSSIYTQILYQFGQFFPKVLKWQFRSIWGKIFFFGKKGI